MPVEQLVRLTEPEPETAREDANERELAQLATLIEDAQGMFALMLVRSDCAADERDALLARLGAAISPLPVRVVRLARGSYQAPVLIAEAAAELPEGVLVLIGLEETPGIVQEPVSMPQRPPAIALLNHGRESIRRSCPLPLIIWCDPLSYQALRQHAPDFFDHFSGLFTFLSKQPERVWDFRSQSLSTAMLITENKELHAAALAEVEFYEAYLEELVVNDERRVPAIFRLAICQLDIRDQQWPSRVIRAVALVDEGLRTIVDPNHPYWPEACFAAGRVYKALPNGDRSDNQRRAVAYYEAALLVWTEVGHPYEWAMTQNNLGNLYLNLPFGDRVGNLRCAIDLYKAALRVWTEAEDPDDWSMAQNNLGNAFCSLPATDRSENLRSAISCYEAALRIRTETDHPIEWAITQNNLGNAYHSLPVGDRVENLRLAIACYEAALRVQTETACPRDWARTLTNLGITYSELPTDDRGENLCNAIAYYEASLRVRTETDYPYDWAMTQYNIGRTYSRLPIGDPHQNLQRAVNCYEAALRVQTEADSPYEWARTLRNLGMAYQELGQPAMAMREFERSARGYAAVGAMSEVARIEKQLKRLSSAPHVRVTRSMSKVVVTRRK